MVTLTLEGIIRLFNFEIPVLKKVLPTSKQNCHFLKMFLLNEDLIASPIEAQQPQIIFIVSSGDEEVLLFSLNIQTGAITALTAFKRPSFSKITDIKIFKNSYILLMLESNQIEIIQIMNYKQMVKKYKRKAQRKVKDLASLEDYSSQACNYLLFKKHISLEYPTRSIFIDEHFLPNKSEPLLREIFFFTSRNSYFKGIISLKETEETLSNIKTFSNFGHQNPVKFIQISNDDSLIMSASKEAIMFWDADECSTIKKLAIENATCGFFLPKNKYIIIGDVEGQIWLIDVLSGNVLDVLQTIGNLLIYHILLSY